MYIRNNLGSFGGLEGYWAPALNRQGDRSYDWTTNPLNLDKDTDQPGFGASFFGDGIFCGKREQFLCSDMRQVQQLRAKKRAIRNSHPDASRDKLRMLFAPTRKILRGLRSRASAAKLAPPTPPAVMKPTKPTVAAPVVQAPVQATVAAPVVQTPAETASVVEPSMASIVEPSMAPVQSVPAVAAQVMMPGMPLPMVVGAPVMVQRAPIRRQQVRRAAPARIIASPIIGKKLPVAAGMAALAAMLFM